MKKSLLILCAVLGLASCEAIFVENISDKEVAIISPVDNSQLDDKVVVFSWKQVTDAEAYRLRVVTPNFGSATKVVLDTTITKTLFTKELSSGSYEWSIHGKNAEYETKETRSSFTIN